jgi:antitoxin CcdA
MRIITTMPRKNPLTPAATRRPTNVTLPDSLLGEARELKINVSQACERGLAQAVAETKTQQWQAENQVAIEAWNQYTEQHGLPLARFRQF